jgi:hypothetical protein
MDDDDFDPSAELANNPNEPRSLFPEGVPLAEYDPETGTYRDERGRDVGEAVDSGIHLLIEEDHSVHGLYKGLGADGNPVDGWASLLVYRFKFRTTGTSRSRRFKAYRIKVSFETAQAGATALDFDKHPEITRIEPAQYGDVYLFPTTVHITDKLTKQLQAGVDKTVKLQGVLKSETGEEFDTLYAAEVSTQPDQLKVGQTRRNGQWWKAVGNPKQNEATIPKDFVVAIILKRPNNEKFNALFEIDEGLDTWSTVKRAFNKTTRAWSTEYDPAHNKPVQRPPEDPDVRADNLSDLTKGVQKLYKFCAIHVAEEVKPKKYYGDGTSSLP